MIKWHSKSPHPFGQSDDPFIFCIATELRFEVVDSNVGNTDAVVIEICDEWDSEMWTSQRSPQTIAVWHATPSELRYPDDPFQ